MNPISGSRHPYPYITSNKPTTPDDFKDHPNSINISIFKKCTCFTFLDYQKEMVELIYPQMSMENISIILDAFRVLLTYNRTTDPICFDFKEPNNAVRFSLLPAKPFKIVCVSVLANEVKLFYRLDDNSGTTDYRLLAPKELTKWCENFQLQRNEFRRSYQLNQIKKSTLLFHEKIVLDTNRWRDKNIRCFYLDCQPAKYFENSKFILHYKHVVTDRVIDISLAKGSLETIVQQVSLKVAIYMEELVTHLRFNYGFNTIARWQAQPIDEKFLKSLPKGFFVMVTNEGFNLSYLHRMKIKCINFSFNMNALKNKLKSIEASYIKVKVTR